MAATLGFMFFMLFLLVFAHERVKTESVCTAYTMVVYITICFVCLIKLRYVTMDVGSNSGRMVGQYIYLLVFLAAWITDTFAYFTGFFFGKHKLCPNISPKKTVEGCLIGVVMGSLIGAVYYYNVIGNIDIFLVILLSICLSILSEIGDLVFSSIKRYFDVKDYSNLIPGHGGLLDRLDSVIFVALGLLLFLNII